MLILKIVCLEIIIFEKIYTSSAFDKIKTTSNDEVKIILNKKFIKLNNQFFLNSDSKNVKLLKKSWNLPIKSLKWNAKYALKINEPQQLFEQLYEILNQKN